MRGQLAPHLEEFIAGANQAIATAKEEGVVPNPELARANLQKLSAFVTQVPKIAYAESHYVFADSMEIPVRVYSPAPSEALPVLIYFHGGGHMCGSTELYDPMCRKLAIAARCIVISVEYRLAPEFPYPAGVNDCEDVVKGFHQVLKSVEYGNDVYIGGDSAGGAICTTLARRQIADKELKFSKQILIYPSVDYTCSQPSVDENGTGYLLEKQRIQWYFDNYFDDYEDRQAMSPLFGEFNADMPETLVIVAGCDPLRDEGLLYADKLREAGASVTVHSFDHMIHAFMNLEDLVPNECRDLFKTIGKFIKG
jgi:acetyl esterase